MKTFVQTLYDYNFVETVTEYNSDKEDEITISIVTPILMVTCNSQAIVILLKSYREDNSGKKDEMEIALSESQPPHRD